MIDVAATEFFDRVVLPLRRELDVLGPKRVTMAKLIIVLLMIDLPPVERAALQTDLLAAKKPRPGVKVELSH
jgi:hypothetical protein